MKSGKLRPIYIGLLLSSALICTPSLAKEPKNQPSVEAAPAPIAYSPAENRHIRVTVDQVIAANSKEYLPKDKHWLQLRVLIANKGSGTMAFSGLRQRMTDGTVMDAAVASSDVTKPPNMTGSLGKQMGIGTAAAAAGWFIAPPLMLVGSLAGAFKGTLGMDKKANRQRLIDQTILKATPIAPATSISGWAYVPALQNHNGLIVFYSVDGRLESIALQRMGVPGPVMPVVAAPEQPAAAPAPRKPARPRRR